MAACRWCNYLAWHLGVHHLLKLASKAIADIAYRYTEPTAFENAWSNAPADRQDVCDAERREA